jgi:hypothetical protein
MPVGLTITNKQVTEIEWETVHVRGDWRVSILERPDFMISNT